jgi:hypothetical protein
MNNNWRSEKVWQPKNPEHPYLHIAAAAQQPRRRHQDYDEIDSHERYLALHETLLRHSYAM